MFGIRVIVFIKVLPCFNRSEFPKQFHLNIINYHSVQQNKRNCYPMDIGMVVMDCHERNDMPCLLKQDKFSQYTRASLL